MLFFSTIEELLCLRMAVASKEEIKLLPPAFLPRDANLIQTSAISYLCCHVFSNDTTGGRTTIYQGNRVHPARLTHKQATGRRYVQRSRPSSFEHRSVKVGKDWLLRLTRNISCEAPRGGFGPGDGMVG
jgi:hypothetical protein